MERDVPLAGEAVYPFPWHGDVAVIDDERRSHPQHRNECRGVGPAFAQVVVQTVHGVSPSGADHGAGGEGRVHQTQMAPRFFGYGWLITEIGGGDSPIAGAAWCCDRKHRLPWPDRWGPSNWGSVKWQRKPEGRGASH